MPSLASVSKIAMKVGRVRSDSLRVATLNRETTIAKDRITRVSQEIKRYETLSDIYRERIAVLEKRYEVIGTSNRGEILNACMNAYTTFHHCSDMQRALRAKRDDLLYSVYENEIEIESLTKSIESRLVQLEPTLNEIGLSCSTNKNPVGETSVDCL